MRRSNSLQWLFEPLTEEPSFIEKPMFGCLAGYLYGKLMLVLADGDEPWNGLLVCTDKAKHAALQDQFKGLAPHPILGKWLYVPQDDERFEDNAQEIVRCVLAADDRIGVEGAKKKVKKKARLPARRQRFKN